jgi:Calcineurin-like phosphoesterase
MPDPEKHLKTLYKANEAIRSTPGRRGRFVELQDADEILVAGDMHGHLGNFQAVYKAADLARHPRRHLVLQEVIHGKFHYPLGGDKSHQLLDLFAALKCQYPRQVHLLMGNHELSQWTDSLVMKNDQDLNQLFLAGVHEAYGSRATEIYQGYQRFFSTLPLALRTPNRIFISHTLPRGRCLDSWELRLLETDSFSRADLTPGGIVYEILWGRDTRQVTCDAFLAKVDCDWLLSGHIASEAGYSTPNDRQIIVDSCDSPAAYVLLPANRPLSHTEFLAGIRMIGAAS